MPATQRKQKKKERVKTPKRGARVTETQYQALIVAFRQSPGMHYKAAKMADVSGPTARRAWDQGWDSRGWPSIKSVIASEQIEARAQAAEARRAHAMDWESRKHEEELQRMQAVSDRATEARDKARADAIRSREEEGEMVQIARGAVRINLGSLTSLSRAVLRHSVPELIAQIESGYKYTRINGRLRKVKLSSEDHMRMLQRAGSLLSKVIPEAERAIKIERLLMGEPTDVIGINMKGMDLNDAIHTAETCNWAVERAKKRRGLVALPGGKSDGDPGIPAEAQEK